MANTETIDQIVDAVNRIHANVTRLGPEFNSRSDQVLNLHSDFVADQMDPIPASGQRWSAFPRVQEPYRSNSYET